jgi:uncharacterized phage-like protein YoqJ
MIVAVTGHRPDKLGGYSSSGPHIKLSAIATNWLEVNKPEYVITGMAQGWDLIIAETCLKLKIPYIAAIPFKGQELLWPEHTQRYYQVLLGAAEDAVVVSPGVFSSRKMHIRNEWMVDRGDTILAMWDGSQGGTGSCIKYAKSKNKPIINLYDQFKP